VATGTGAVVLGTPAPAGAGWTDNFGGGSVVVGIPALASAGKRGALGTGAITIPDLAAGNNPPISYAVIVAGRVVSIGYGPQPDSTTSTLYFSLVGVSPTPAAGWYYSDVCSTFSEAAPTVPAGDIVPPFTGGGGPADDGGGGVDGGGGPPDEEDPDIRSHVLPDLITWAADADGLLTIDAVPELETSLGNKYHLAYDFTEVCYLRLQAEVITPSSAGAVLKLQYYDTTLEEWVDLEYIAP